jgi:hypothetical protein
MALLTLSRREWAAIVDELDFAYSDHSPPGLRERIAALLEVTPSAWTDQACQLELTDLAAVELVRSIAQRSRRQVVEPHFLWQEQASIAEAEQIIRNHQHRIGEA